MEKRKRYKLPFKTRLALLILKIKKGKEFHELTLKEIKDARKPAPKIFITKWMLGRGPQLKEVSETHFSARDNTRIRVRIYRPQSSGPCPIILNYHGGGWAVGTLENNEFYCRTLAHEIGAVVVSVDYRLAPENKFPVPMFDCYDAFLWAHENAHSLGGDPSRMAVTGDSAGGNLSASVSLMARDMDGPGITCQALIYPATDARLEYASLETHANAPILGKKDVLQFLDHYIKSEDDKKDPYLSPIMAESLAGLPPALVITAGNDPLADDGKQYYELLKAANVPTEWHFYPDDIHGFVSLPNHTKSGRIAIQRIAAWMKEKLQAEPTNPR